MRVLSNLKSELLMLCTILMVFALPYAGKVSATLVGTPQEFSFHLTAVPENPSRYSLVISDGDERNISGMFSINQLQILRAIMTEAEKFAFNAEAVGSKDPITTRFEDKQEDAFIVDVEKAGNQSRLFLTLKSEIGRMTVEAGKAVRSSRREEGLFFDLLSRLETILPKLPTRSGN